MNSLGLFVLVTVVSWFGVRYVRCWAERRRLVDIPNPRSSHDRPVPHGGGLVIVGLTCTISLIVWRMQSASLAIAFPAFVFGSGLVAVVSWVDDVRPVPGLIRFIFQGIAAALVLLFHAHWGRVAVPFADEFYLGKFGLPLSFLWVVGLTNAYNFMDGIDGLAGGQAVVGGLGWVMLARMMDLPFVGLFGALLAATSLGFLFHNWPPARIFMGDVGSAFMGFSFAYLTIISSQTDPAAAVCGVLLLWPFIFDTVFTLVRRARRGEDIFSAHRSHLYQRLVISGLTHRTVTLFYMGLSVLGVLLAGLFSLAWDVADMLVVLVVPIAGGGLWGGTVFLERRAGASARSLETEKER